MPISWGISFVRVLDVIGASDRWQRSAFLFFSSMQASAAPFDEFLHVFLIDTKMAGQESYVFYCQLWLFK
jgi:hypothetical protein